MIRFIGGKKKARSSVNAATEALLRENGGETGMYDEENGKVYATDGTSATIVPNVTLLKLVDILSGILLQNSISPPLTEGEILKALDSVGEPFYSGVVQLTQKRLRALHSSKQ